MPRDKGPAKKLLRSYALPILGGAVGLLLALLILIIGFWRTLLIALFVGGGVWLGLWLMHRTPLSETISRLLQAENDKTDDDDDFFT